MRYFDVQTIPGYFDIQTIPGYFDIQTIPVTNTNFLLS